ncbi:MAG: transposase [Planctomycetaceae bacterium]|nr:transposase [Planctomycetaceae bacterium]
MIDESGLLLAPPARRTWESRGQTPELVPPSGERQKVSVATALGLSPLRDRPGELARTWANGSYDTWDSAASLEALLKELPGRVVVVQDGGGMPKGDPIAPLRDVMSDRLGLERPPPSSPRLAPVEPAWNWLKSSRSCTFAPEDAIQPDGCMVAELSALRDDQE